MQRQAKVLHRLAMLAENPTADGGAQPIALPDSTGTGGTTRIRFVRTPLHNLVDELGFADRPAIDQAMQTLGITDTYSAPERIIDWFIKHQGLGRTTFGTSNIYEAAWQKFVGGLAAQHSSIPMETRIPPGMRLVQELGRINPRAYQRAVAAVGPDDARIIDWFVKKEGLGGLNWLGRPNEYEPAWQQFLSALAQERQPRPPAQDVGSFPWEQALPSAAPPPPEPGTSAPGQADPETIITPNGFQDARGRVVVGAASEANTNNLVNQLFTSIGGKNSPQAQAFIGKLRTRIQMMQSVNQPLTVRDFLTLVGRYANQEFGFAGGAEIAGRMGRLSTNDLHVVSSSELRDDHQLNISYLLDLLQ
jgi:hypothetical protein